MSPADAPPAGEPDNVRAFDVPPVVKTVDLACPPDAAFAAFADGVGRWWPLSMFSLGGAKAVGAAIEPRVGGRVFERHDDGSEHVWGSVVAWEPPSRLAFTWHVGRSPESAQTVEVTFAAAGDAGTRVTLVHRGWERLGDDARARRDEYDRGWEEVFVRRYAAFGAAGSP